MVPGTKIYSLYRHLPVAMQNVLVSAYGYHLHKRRYGPEHDQTLRDLLESWKWPLERVRDLQWQRLKATVELAYTQVPYYKRAWRNLDFAPGDLKSWDDFERLPITEKDSVKETPWDFVPEPLHHDRSSLLTGHTSGTTGKPLVTIKDRSVHQRVWAYQERQRRVWGLDKDRARATIHNRLIVPQEQEGPPYWRYNYVEKQWLFSNLHLREDCLDAYLEKLAALDVEEINGYPSAIATIAEHAVRTGFDRVRPKAVITLAETVYENQRELIDEAFGCPIADQYGSAEVVVWVGQCPSGTYHVNHEFGHFETVDGQDKVLGVAGDVVGTSFVNPVQVLIRYRIGDRAVLSSNEGACACGWQTAHVEGILGRIDDAFYTPDGRTLGRLDLVAKNLPGVRECQLAQDATDHIVARLVAMESPSELAEQTMIERLRGFVGSEMRLDVEWVDQIPRSKAGKFRFQINEIGRPGTSRAGAAMTGPEHPESHSAEARS